MSRDQNAGRSHSMKTDNSSFDMVEEFKYLGTNITNQSSIKEEIKSRLKLWNASYHSVQNILSSMNIYVRQSNTTLKYVSAHKVTCFG
jgi:hypothetical protein